MKSRRWLLLVALLLLPASARLAWGQSWEKQFKQNMASPDSSVRYEAVRQLDPNDSEQLKQIVKVLKINNPKVTDWHIRHGAVQALTKASDGDALETLRKELSKGKPFVREAIVASFGMRKDPQFFDDIDAALGDKYEAVRRAAIQAMSGLKKKEAIESLLAHWPNEDMVSDFRQWSLVKQALETMTGKYLGGDVRDWNNWWAANKDKFSFDEEWEDEEKRKADEKAAEEAGHKAKEVKTVARNVPLNFKVRGIGAPLLVIPLRGYHEDYFQPYLQTIEDICKVHYVRLPKPNDFEGLERGPGGTPYYPVDKLVDAFEEARKQFNYKRFAILTHGITSTVAQRYATKYPQSVSHMLFVGAYSGSDAYSKIISTMEAKGKERGDLELEHLAQALTTIDQEGNHKYEPKDADEATALFGRKSWSLFFFNPHDLAVHLLHTQHELKDGGGRVFFPKFDTFKEAKAPAGVLIMNGKHSLWTSVSDAEKIDKHYPNSRMVIFEKSTMMPFVEENEKFSKVVHQFFKDFRIKSG